MPYVDYAEWYRQQQKLQGNTGSPYAAGGVNPADRYQGYKPEGWSEQRGELIRTGTETLSGAAQGASVGSVIPGVGTVIGGAVGGALGAARGMAKEAREGIQAYKQGDSESLSRNPWLYLSSAATPFMPGLGPMAGAWSIARRKLGLSKDVDPLDWSARIGKELFGGAQTKIEEKRWDKLKDYGFEVPAWVKDKAKKPGVYRKEFGEDFIGTDAEGNPVNNKFAKSRNEADLTANDIKDFASNYETFGDVYAKATDEEKKRIMQIALDNKLIQEARGTVQVNWNEDTLKQATDILAQVAARNPDAQAGRKMWVMPTETAWKMPGAK